MNIHQESELLQLGFVFEKRKNSKFEGGEVKMEKISSYKFEDIKVAYERYKEIKGECFSDFRYRACTYECIL
jgi:hypothetical protein